MGFLRSVFRRDWGAELERAEKLLADGQAVRALEIARRAERSADDSLRGSAGLLIDRAERSLVESSLARADAAEAKGAYEDAADWLLAAIDRLGGDPRQGELTDRREELLLRAEQERIATVSTPAAGPEPHPELDLETLYEALVSMLDPQFVERYANRPRRFREALVALNEGNGEAALEVLDELVRDLPADGILHLERGRSYLLLGDAALAREDLETAWRELGDVPIDLIDSISAPSLWAEAALELGDDEGVVARLAALSDPAGGRADICHHYGFALLATGRTDSAQSYLRTAIGEFQGDPRFPLLLAEALAEVGDLGAAIDCLESSIAPSCSGAGCSRRSKHLPSFRALAGLHLELGEHLDRVPELIAHIAHDQAGYLEDEDQAMLERYYELSGAH